jgi:hypothetical protein
MEIKSSYGGSIAPEYSDIVSLTGFVALTDGTYEPNPIWKDGKMVKSVVPRRYFKNSVSFFNRGMRAVLMAAKHLFYATAIIMFFSPENPNALVKDGIPYGALSFLTQPEMNAILAVIKLCVLIGPELLETDSMDTLQQRAVYFEVLRYLTRTMKTIDLASNYLQVRANLSERREIVRDFLSKVKDAWSGLPNMQKIVQSNAAQNVIREGGRAHMRAMGI